MKKSRRRLSLERRDKAMEGDLWSGVIAVSIFVLASSCLGWYLLRQKSFSQRNLPNSQEIGVLKSISESGYEVINRRRQILSRLKILQVERNWFLDLVDMTYLVFASRSSTSSSFLESAQELEKRKLWNDLSYQWLIKMEKLPIPIRNRLGSFRKADWQNYRKSLSEKVFNPSLIDYLAEFWIDEFLDDSIKPEKMSNPFFQIWYASVLNTFQKVHYFSAKKADFVGQRIDLKVSPGELLLVSLEIPYKEFSSINFVGTPFMRMSIVDSKNRLNFDKERLQKLEFINQLRKPFQLIIFNSGLSQSGLTIFVDSERKRS